MRRLFLFLSLSCLLMGTVGCGASADKTINLSKEEEEKKIQEQRKSQEEGMRNTMESMGQQVPPVDEKK